MHIIYRYETAKELKYLNFTFNSRIPPSNAPQVSPSVSLSFVHFGRRRCTSTQKSRRCREEESEGGQIESRDGDFSCFKLEFRQFGKDNALSTQFHFICSCCMKILLLRFYLVFYPVNEGKCKQKGKNHCL